MRIIIELKTDCLKNGDVVYYQDGEWINKSKKSYLHDTEREIEALKEENAELKTAFETLKKSVNEKLKQYHDVLKLSVEEGE